MSTLPVVEAVVPTWRVQDFASGMSEASEIASLKDICDENQA